MDKVTLKEAFAAIRFLLAIKFKNEMLIQTCGLIDLPIDFAWEEMSIALNSAECAAHHEGEPAGIFPGGALMKKVMKAAKDDLESCDINEIEDWLRNTGDNPL